MNLAALRLSLQYGNGDVHWFSRLPREDRALMLAYDRVTANPKGTGRTDADREAAIAQVARKLAQRGGS